MKAITIKQPWATLIALGEKRFETRSWQTKYRGQIAIHAGKSVDKDACNDSWIKGVLKEHKIESYKDLPTGVVIAMAEIADCHKVLNFCNQVATTTGPNISGLEIKFGDYTEGRYAWELLNVNMLSEPIQAKGKLSLWEWDGKL
ncbi:ASCH domain-containing protein [Pseudogracilibacillus sp. SO30301A]|uniref:ASCH domain-containing protein n=1 Tax=Pseudogracilibacillus sp. SO30301A TaxID=3098291 RepID=UPI00300DFF9A